MPVAVSEVLSDDTAEQFRILAGRECCTVSELASRAIEENVRCARFPGIWFITGGSGQRKATLRGGPSVWSVVFVARGYDMAPEKTAAHFERPIESIRLAFAYYAAYPHETDARLQRMEEIEENHYLLHPNVRVISVDEL